MSRTQHDERLTADDARLVAGAEADLEQILSIEPSPVFAAKVRARVEREREQPAGWSIGWRWALAAASLAAVAIAIAFALRTGPAQVPPSTPAVVESGPARSPASQVARVAQPETRNGQPATGRRQPATGNRKPAAPMEPEVLVPPDQRIALQRALSNGALDERMFVEAPANAVVDAPAAVPIVIDDVVVPPAVPGDVPTTSGRRDADRRDADRH